ncbi:hypothetical protein C0Q70_03323 [Pomacea canaliculata]|uniref:SMP-30/Gluconolactonase/LRE-like region domain-containing protein n=1 Tax=Pomacea canaliculata TaxID=400727 RepID=A0A2T7PSE9_POMCA|nr:hypothetical protein C0Q70_03323 [Pomacea canaliculata]
MGFRPSRLTEDSVELVCQDTVMTSAANGTQTGFDCRQERNVGKMWGQTEHKWPSGRRENTLINRPVDSKDAPSQHPTSVRTLVRDTEISNETFRENQLNSQVNFKGHVNVLFRYDEDLSPGCRIQYGREIVGRDSGHGYLQDATDVLCLSNSCILVTDFVNSRLQKFSNRGEHISYIKDNELLEPWATVMAPNGCLAVTSRKKRQVVLLNKDGQFQGSFGEDRFGCPSGIAVAADGNFVVSDFVRNKVLAFTPAGQFVHELGGRGVTFHQPRYVTVSQQGDIIVSDSGSHQLKVFDQSWKYIRSIGGYGKQDGCLKFPHATCVDVFGNILVCDRYNDRVSVFTRRGEFVRHLLTAAHGIRHPQGLTLSPDLHLYVTHGDLKANCVMVFSLQCEQEHWRKNVL